MTFHTFKYDLTVETLKVLVSVPAQGCGVYNGYDI